MQNETNPSHRGFAFAPPEATKSRAPHLGVWVMCGVLLVAGCAREDPFSNDPHIAMRQVAELLPKGTPETRAKKALSERGFDLSRLSSDAAANHILVGTYVKGDRVWQVGLIIINGKVVASSVTISDAGVAKK